MGKRPALVLAVLAWALPSGAQVVTEMTPERIRDAIADTKTDGCYELRKGYACFTTPYSRVVLAARSAKKEYKPFAEADAADLLAPFIEVVARPQPSMIIGSGRTGPPIDVKTIVVLPRKRT